MPRAASPPKCNTIAGTEQDQVEIEGYASAFGNNGVIRHRAENNEASPCADGVHGAPIAPLEKGDGGIEEGWGE